MGFVRDSWRRLAPWVGGCLIFFCIVVLGYAAVVEARMFDSEPRLKLSKISDDPPDVAPGPCAAILGADIFKLDEPMRPNTGNILPLELKNTAHQKCVLKLWVLENFPNDLPQKIFELAPGQSRQFTIKPVFDRPGRHSLSLKADLPGAKAFSRTLHLSVLVKPTWLAFMTGQWLAVLGAGFGLIATLLGFFRRDPREAPPAPPSPPETETKTKTETPTPRAGFLYKVPNRRAEKFVGRAKELEAIRKALESNGKAVITAVSGMGGVGKSELAIEYVHGASTDYPGGVCWLDAREDVPIQLMQFGHVKFDLNYPEGTEPEANVDRVLERWLDQERALLVVDNWPETENFPKFLETLPACLGVLLTSRVTVRGANIHTIPIDVLEPDAAKDLLLSYVDASRHEEDQAAELAKWLGYLPLAIDLIGSYLREHTDLNLANMLARLKEKRLQHNAFQYPHGAGFTRPGLVEALELSRAELDETQLALAGMLAVLAEAPIPPELIGGMTKHYASDGHNADDWDEALHVLVKRNLLKREDEGFYRLHPLVREYFRSRESTTDECKRAVAEELVERAKKVGQAITLQQAEAIAAVVPHWYAVVDGLHEYLDDADITWCHTALSRYYELYGNYEESESLLRAACDLSEEKRGVEHPDTATNLNNLAELYRSQGRYAEAEPLCSRALAIYEAQLGAEHPHTALSLNNLAALYKSQGRYGEAEPLYERALEICEKQLGAEHPLTATSLNNLALLYDSQGRYAEAEPLFSRALEINEKQLGADHPDTAMSLNNLAGLYESQGRYAKAEPLYSRALKIREKQLGAEHPYTATSLNNLALLYDLQGRYAEAEPLHERALKIREKRLGAEHPDTAGSLNNLAGLYYSQGRHDEAEPLLSCALEIYEKQLGAEHPNTVKARENLEILRRKMKEDT